MPTVVKAHLTGGTFVVKTDTGAVYRYALPEAAQQLSIDIPDFDPAIHHSAADVVGLVIDRQTRAAKRKHTAYNRGYEQGMKDLIAHIASGETKGRYAAIAAELVRKQKERDDDTV